MIQGKPVELFNGSSDRKNRSPPGVMKRQNMNTQTAINFALTKNITWLLHIDNDELFYEQGDRSWVALEGVGHVTFINHEAVPLSYEGTNYFAGCTVFKVDGIEFMAYQGEKSAVRLSHGVRLIGVHKFTGYLGEHRTLSKPMILHYPHPSFESWVAKFTRYGWFAEIEDQDYPEVKGYYSAGKGTREFMFKSRDLVQAALSTGHWAAARAFYDEQVYDDVTVQYFLSKKTLRRYSPLIE